MALSKRPYGLKDRNLLYELWQMQKGVTCSHFFTKTRDIVKVLDCRIDRKTWVSIYDGQGWCIFARTKGDGALFTFLHSEYDNNLFIGTAEAWATIQKALKKQGVEILSLIFEAYSDVRD